MGFPRISYFITLFLIISLTKTSFSQIVFKELAGYQITLSDSAFFNLTETRSIIPLNGKWVVFSAKEETPQKTSINIPSIFKGDAELIFEKTFNLTSRQVREKKIKLYFLGLNYLADIILNGVIIYRHRGGEFPFFVELPRDILHSEKYNLLSVKLSYNPDPENTIPLMQRFLFPASYGGILKDVYLYLEPGISITDFDYSIAKDSKLNKLVLNLSEQVENKDYKKIPDTLKTKKAYELSINLYNPDQSLSASGKTNVFELKKNEKKRFDQTFNISNPVMWLPNSKQLYKLEISLLLDGELIDKVIKEIPAYFLTTDVNGIELNDLPFSFNGVVYVPSFGEYGNLASYQQMEDDIKFIAQTGFNSVRFAKSVPHPYYLRLCEKYGLLAFLEIPIDYVPSVISSDPDFIVRSKNYLNDFIKGYSGFGKFAAIGLGSSYLPDLPEHQLFLNELVNALPKKKSFLNYASFAGIHLEKINNLDLYGIEISGDSFLEDTSDINVSLEKTGKGKIFFSSVTYYVNERKSNGYINENTYDAQAKYFEDFISSFSERKISGYFINSMFNYRGDFSSLVAGFDEHNVYNIGLVSEDRSTAYLSQKVIQSKLQNTERLTIPIGTRNDNSPMAFIVIGIALALIVGVLVNSGRKFREDASRALLRPYNFFADVRDQRIMSSYHSTILALVLAVVMALILSSLLFYLKGNIAFEKILLSSGSTSLIAKVSYFSWNPFQAIGWLSIFFTGGIILLVLVIKFASFFVKNRVYLSSIYFTVVWALLPLVLLIPAGIILYRALDSGGLNLYVYSGLLLFAIWIFHRLMKGIYVIFDINSGRVYFYSILIVIVLFTALAAYYEIKNSFIDYLLLTFKQYNISDLL